MTLCSCSAMAACGLCSIANCMHESRQLRLAQWRGRRTANLHVQAFEVQQVVATVAPTSLTDTCLYVRCYYGQATAVVQPLPVTRVSDSDDSDHHDHHHAISDHHDGVNDSMNLKFCNLSVRVTVAAAHGGTGPGAALHSTASGVTAAWRQA